MLKYLFRRACTYVVMAFLATTAAYFLACSYFKPGQLMMQDQAKYKTRAMVDAELSHLGLDPNRPVYLRYLDWLHDVVFHFNWGLSPDSSSVNHEFGNRVWISFALTIVTIVLTIVIGIALGVWTASRQYSAGDRIVTGYSYLTYIIPAPVAYLMCQLFFVKMNEVAGHRILFVTGIHDPTVTGFWPTVLDYAAHYIVPTITMTIYGWAGYQVSQRQFLLDNINADFVRTARSTGLTRGQAIRRHALRVSFIPVAQSIAYTIPAVFTGSFFAEMIFAWPGLGVWSIQALSKQDVNVAVAMVAYGAVIFAIGAILADFATTLVDPRVRMS